MCSVVECTSWRKCQWVKFIAECSEQRNEMAVYFVRESFEESADTDSQRSTSMRIKSEDEREFGDSLQKGSSQQSAQKHHSEISSPSNQDCADLIEDMCGSSSDKDWTAPETQVVVVKEENIKMESDFSNQTEAARGDNTFFACSAHRDEESSEESSEEDSDNASDEDSDKDSEVERKRASHKKQLCDDCGCFYNLKKSHTCEYKLKPYACNMCGKRYRTKEALKSHSHTHDSSQMHNCKYCYAPFKTKQDKFIHQETHKEQNPFKCHSCPATFSCFLDRRNHLRMHPRARAHKCEKCDITFTRKHVLARHMVIHSGEKAFTCSVCERGFNQHGHLKSHMRLHTGEKPYKCKNCDKAFNHNVSLKSHIQRYHSYSRPHKNEDACVGNGTDSGNDLVNGQDEVKEVQAEVLNLGRWSTGRPKGRPKKNNPEEKLSPKRKRNVNKLRNSNRSFDLNEHVEKLSKKVSRCSSSQRNNSVDPDYMPGKTWR